jgi:hypothetical protein
MKSMFPLTPATALGILGSAYPGLSFTTPGKTINFLGRHLALVGGIVLLLVKPKSV